jgi:hypothetical protein
MQDRTGSTFAENILEFYEVRILSFFRTKMVNVAVYDTHGKNVIFINSKMMFLDSNQVYY